VLDWIWSFSARPRSPDQVTAQRAVKLERMALLLEALGNPQRVLAHRTVLIAGTKGKGSTAAMVDACLQAAGVRTGLYTSPHLVNWRERTCVDGQPISTAAVTALAEPVRAAVETLPSSLPGPTTFEVGTALSLLYFARQRVQAAVLEVGTGGRFDATNLVEAAVSAITPISYDHTPTLGDTLTQIAWHKAGILRAGQPAISGPQPDEARRVIEREAATLGATLEEVGRDWWWSALETRHAPNNPIEIRGPRGQHFRARVGLLGDHQRDNATVAAAALDAFGRTCAVTPLDAAAIEAGLANVDWPGRLQILSERPLVVLDGAHNVDSAEVLRAALDKYLTFDHLHLVFGLSVGKDARGVLEALAPGAEVVYLTRSHHERATPPAELEPLVRQLAPYARVQSTIDPVAAFEAALAAASQGDLVLVTGSLFLVGEALVWWRSSPR
jgi:dihydrofolate synthase/folylpolyglutamate synthase